MTALPCPICAGDSYFFYDYEDFFGSVVSLFKCNNCGHGFHDAEYSAEQFSEIYQADYAEGYISKESELSRQRRDQYALDVEYLLACKPMAQVRVLDYGCSSGDYLDAMPENWVKSGYEVNPVEIAHLRDSKKHITVYDDPGGIDQQFDLITLRGVIEHIPDHADLITFLKARLVPGGSVYITATPDFSSVCATLYKSHWNQVSCPEHIHQFSTASLSLLLAKAGLALHSLSHAYLNTPYANWEKDKARFTDNFRRLEKEPGGEIKPKHPFAGNMISALYEKAR